MQVAEFFLSLAILLFSAKLAGELFERFGLSSLVGEISAGILIGPILGIITPSENLKVITDFGILFMLFLIGLGTKFDEIKNSVYVGSALATAGCLLAAVAGFIVGYVFFSFTEGIILGVAVLSTSTAITLRALSDAGEFQTKSYKLALAIDIADEVIAILALALLTTYFTIGSVKVWEIVSLFFAVLGFFFFIVTAGSRITRKFLSLFQTMRDEQIMVAMPLVVLFLIAFVSEHVGIAAVTGAFLAGVALNKSPLIEPVVMPKMKVIAYGLFVPMFFAYSAILLDLGALADYLPAIALLTVLVSIGKFIGCGVLAGRFGYSSHEQQVVGVGMIPHGEYSILIAQIALLAGYIKIELYTVVIAFVVLSIIMTPILLNPLRTTSRRKF